MILLLDTSTPICKFTLVEGDNNSSEEWQADRRLARDLLKQLIAFLDTNNCKISDLTGLGVFMGPGSFTGLRIGLTVLNTIADSENIPIVGGKGEAWEEEVLAKLRAGQDDKIVLPFYGAGARITSPKK
ncbi:MAG TPA: tRNA (adenosine(37)-N6)-threonylcarbamoyltransferase complex dimerization subunit type 1 TsaB [Candidatus Saccharibacteria bacterium]|nr:tRNA (adenosine(37)-N6)-threonylcarbamoyltransferase complex dimerization subunit type 1 TsaB [Candidatus Saccharibacteria bacterium]HRQ07265.1 tRNA (adenosine(37)-N6)-threonylcarbamoyltransferase complex dimerization subunit type 1 TsaB [Candidatus Saccharibacteria bacterium]